VGTDSVSVVIEDLDGDGTLDLALAAGADDAVVLLTNQLLK
jgi:hypothetical protein